MERKCLDPFLEHRRAQERAHAQGAARDAGPMASLISVEINATELCNRKCVFCPRVDPQAYPNRNLHMPIEVLERVADDLARLRMGSRVSFSGFGEPMLHRAFPELVRAARERLPDNTIECNTNGDRLTTATARGLFDAGLTYLYVNLYDGPEQERHFRDVFAEAGIDPSRYRLRPHWAGATDGFGLTLNNRSGTVNRPDIGVAPLARPLATPCFYPFYKMLVDWNGDVPFCSNDWGRAIVVGNVLRQPIEEIWLSASMQDIRRRLAQGDRDRKPCSTCSVDGTLHGRSSFERLMAFYGERGSLAAGTDAERDVPG
ncbi:MAG: radical SAM/SPASM domain-containing protein [Gammaproteobacteria bacterium]